MRYCLLVLFLDTCFTAFCGQEPVKWKILDTPGGNQQFTLVVYRTIEPGWHVYAQCSASERLECINLNWDNKYIHAKSELVPGQEASAISDPIFNTS